MSAVTDALAEVDAALAAAVAPHEGLRDYNRLNLEAEAKAEVQEGILFFDTRVALLEEAKAALEALLGQGYPEVPVREIVPTAYADLVENRKTIDAALALFAAEQAQVLAMRTGTPEPK